MIGVLLAAAEEAAEEVVTNAVAIKVGLIAISAALAIGLSALATAMAQSRIGAAMAGAVAERPELAGSAIILVAIPETMVILGMVIAFMITGLS